MYVVSCRVVSCVLIKRDQQINNLVKGVSQQLNQCLLADRLFVSKTHTDVDRQTDRRSVSHIYRQTDRHRKRRTFYREKLVLYCSVSSQPDCPAQRRRVEITNGVATKCRPPIFHMTGPAVDPSLTCYDQVGQNVTNEKANLMESPMKTRGENLHQRRRQAFHSIEQRHQNVRRRQFLILFNEKPQIHTFLIENQLKQHYNMVEQITSCRLENSICQKEILKII